MHTAIIKKFCELTAQSTTHGAGQKFIFLNSGDTPTALTQVAYGTLQPGEVIAMHVHLTMEEYFYFLEGEATYTIDNQLYPCTGGTLIRIPAGTLHELKTGDYAVQFFYFGIAV